MFRSRWPINGSSGFLPFTLQFCCKPLGILQKVTKSQKVHISSHDVLKKSHTYEEGGAHLRISFWHLLMNFEKLKKSEFWKKKKKMLDISSFYKCLQFLRYGARQYFLSIWAIFWLLLPTPSKVLDANKPKFWKNEKSIWRCHHQMMYAYSDMECYRNIFCQFRPAFPFISLLTRKIKIRKKCKKQLEVLSFYICAPYIKIIWCMFPDK